LEVKSFLLRNPCVINKNARSQKCKYKMVEHFNTLNKYYNQIPNFRKRKRIVFYQ
jgi:hypothetical protein